MLLSEIEKYNLVYDTKPYIYYPSVTVIVAHVNFGIDDVKTISVWFQFKFRFIHEILLIILIFIKSAQTFVLNIFFYLS